MRAHEVTLTIRMPEALKEIVDAYAKHNHQSLKQAGMELIEKGLGLQPGDIPTPEEPLPSHISAKTGELVPNEEMHT